MEKVTVIYPTWESHLEEIKRQLQTLQNNYAYDLDLERRRHLADDIQAIAESLDGVVKESQVLSLAQKEMFKD